MDTDGGNYPYAESQEKPGTYELFSFKAARGKSYFIDITLSGGKHYQSKPEQLRSSSSIEAISYEVNEETYRNNAGELITENIVSTNISTDFSQSAVPPFYVGE